MENGDHKRLDGAAPDETGSNNERITAHDARQGYCRRLGHHVAFEYCRKGSGDLPCRGVFDCWFETFDITAFMREHFTEEQLGRIIAPPPPKMATLIELIAQAKQRQKPNEPCGRDPNVVVGTEESFPAGNAKEAEITEKNKTKPM